jgi:hypothetical protein
LLFGLVVPTPIAAAVIVGITMLAVFLDLRRRRELLFLGNLGIPDPVILALAALMPMTGEIVVRVLQ